MSLVPRDETENISENDNMQEEKSLEMKIFSSRLKQALKGRKQREIAREIGVGQPSLSGYAGGKIVPSLKIFRALCKSLQVNSDWLLGLTDESSSGVTLSASGGSVAANHSTVSTGGGEGAADVGRLLAIIESQQRVIESLSRR